MINTKTRVAVIGAGEIGTKAHIPAYLKNKDVDLVALVDADQSKLEVAAKKFGVKNQYTSIDELFEKQQIDAISICTPPNSHAQIALTAFEHGAHVLCEKPVATKTEDGKRMYEASLKKEKLLMVGFNLRFQPNYKKAYDIIESGQLGHIYLIECNNLSANPLLLWSKSPWFFKPEAGGGVLADKGPHVFDLLNYAFNDYPKSVSAMASTFYDSPVEDFCVCTLEYGQNQIGIAKMGWVASNYLEGYTIHGTAQTLFAVPEMLLKLNATEIPEVPLWKKTTVNLFNMKFPNLPGRHVKKVDLFQSEIDDFINKVRTGTKYSNSILDGLNALITCEAAKKSIDQGQKIAINPIRANQ
jgi:UDP-N-acetylglucosamine 3-dehydrogenase